MHSFTPIFAEVSDKEPTMTLIWCFAAFVSMLGLLLCRWRRRAALLALPVAAFWAFGITSEVRDPYVGPAILDELGRGYVTQAYLAALVPFVFVAIGFWRHSHDAA
jgi:hypothetical protein